MIPTEELEEHPCGQPYVLKTDFVELSCKVCQGSIQKFTKQNQSEVKSINPRPEAVLLFLKNQFLISSLVCHIEKAR